MNLMEYNEVLYQKILPSTYCNSYATHFLLSSLMMYVIKWLVGFFCFNLDFYEALIVMVACLCV